MLVELAFGSAIDFQHTEWRTITLQNHVHRTANTVLHKQLWRTKSLLVFEMIGNYGLARAQGVARRRCQVGADGGMPNHALAPADTGANQKPILSRDVFHNFAVFRPQTFRRHSRGVIKHFREARALQGKDTKFGEQLLLANAQTECATNQVVWLTITGLAFNNWFFRPRWAHSRLLNMSVGPGVIKGLELSAPGQQRRTRTK